MHVQSQGQVLEQIPLRLCLKMVELASAFANGVPAGINYVPDVLRSWGA